MFYFLNKTVINLELFGSSFEISVKLKEKMYNEE